jgi:hypothetical protein
VRLGPDPGAPREQAMILNHQYHFIFIKTRKTAGSSIEVALSGHCGRRDIITPLAPKDQAIREQKGYPGPQNYLPPGHALACRLLRREPDKKKYRFRNHIPAVQVREKVGSDTWNSYYSFCLERNPWDKVISAYWYLYKEWSREKLADFILSGKAAVYSDWHRYTDNDRIIVSHVGRYENLDDEVAAFCQRVGLPPLDLPRAKGALRKDRSHYRDILTPEERDRISSDFAREIATFNYDF